MIKGAKNVDFYTTGRQPSEQDFASISEWIKKSREKQATRKNAKQTTAQKQLNRPAYSQKRTDKYSKHPR